MKWFGRITNNATVSIVLGSILLVFFWIIFSNLFGYNPLNQSPGFISNVSSTNQAVQTTINANGSPESINTVGQIGNNTIIGTTPRTLSAQQKTILETMLVRHPMQVGFISKMID